MTSFNIRPYEEKDLLAVMEIENLTFISPWKKEEFVSEVNNNEFANIFVYELLDSVNGNKVVGFYDYWVTFDSATIAQIAVHPQYQRLKIGSTMMNEIISDCVAKKVSNITLEVRKNNEKAFKLYRKFDFEVVLTKPNYYSNGDDALYMMRRINNG